MIRGLEHLLSEDRQREFRSFSLKKSPERMYCGLSMLKEGNNFSNRAYCGRIGNDGFKSEKGRFRLGIKQTFFTMALVKH